MFASAHFNSWVSIKCIAAYRRLIPHATLRPCHLLTSDRVSRPKPSNFAGVPVKPRHLLLSVVQRQYGRFGIEPGGVAGGHHPGSSPGTSSCQGLCKVTRAGPCEVSPLRPGHSYDSWGATSRPGSEDLSKLAADVQVVVGSRVPAFRCKLGPAAQTYGLWLRRLPPCRASPHQVKFSED